MTAPFIQPRRRPVYSVGEDAIGIRTPKPRAARGYPAVAATGANALIGDRRATHGARRARRSRAARWRDTFRRMDPVIFRPAQSADLAALVALLADDMLGAARERPGDAGYAAAFAAIEADPNEMLMVAEIGGAVAGCLQLGFIPGLSRRGAWRGQIEGVRVAAALRGRGVGRRMILWAVAECRARGCATVQLTTDKRRHDAHRFYEDIGFVRSHEGMKLTLESA